MPDFPSIPKRVDPVVAADREIESYLVAFGPGATVKLFEAYRIHPDNDEFVAALIARVVMAHVRGSGR